MTGYNKSEYFISGHSSYLLSKYLYEIASSADDRTSHFGYFSHFGQFVSFSNWKSILKKKEFPKLFQNSFFKIFPKFVGNLVLGSPLQVQGSCFQDVVALANQNEDGSVTVTINLVCLGQSSKCPSKRGHYLNTCVRHLVDICCTMKIGFRSRETI